MTTINIDFDKKCINCGTRGTTDCGLCMDCISRVLRNGPMRNAEAAAVAAEIRKRLEDKP